MEDLEYWKTLAKRLEEELDVLREEYSEFQIGSRELEQELEVQLNQSNNRVEDLEKKCARLENELQHLRGRHRETNQELYQLNERFSQEMAKKADLQSYVRELEQDNDDLERAQRATMASLQEFQDRMNEVLEKNVYLESEVEEKNNLLETMQRIKDEARDLRHELLVVQQRTPGHRMSIDDPVPSSPVSINSPQQPFTTPTAKVMPIVVNPVTPIQHQPPVAPSSRVSALYMIAELMKRTDSLENKLLSYRNRIPPTVRGCKKFEVY